MTHPLAHGLIRVAAAALLLAGFSACTPLEVGLGAAAFAGPPATTGRNTFDWLSRAFDKSCSEYSYFDRPTRCVNDRS